MSMNHPENEGDALSYSSLMQAIGGLNDRLAHKIAEDRPVDLT